MADYHVVANGQDLSFTIDQAAVNGWQTLGNADFAAGGSQYINLGDNTGEASSSNTQLVFDAIRISRRWMVEARVAAAVVRVPSPARPTAR